MAKLTISKSDLTRRMPSPDGWYKAKLFSFNEEINKKKDGTNYVPTFEYKGKDDVDKQVRTWFSNKSLGLDFAKFYFACLDKHFDIHVLGDTTEFDTSLIKIGTELWIHIIQSVYEGKVGNQVDNYMARSEEVPF